MAIEVFNRYENKYFLTEIMLNRVLAELEEHMMPDKFNRGRKTYSICNIYYDTPDDYLIRTSLAKPAYKEKLRLRAYNIPSKNDIAFLEMKKKFNGLVNKRRTRFCCRTVPFHGKQRHRKYIRGYECTGCQRNFLHDPEIPAADAEGYDRI